MTTFRLTVFLRDQITPLIFITSDFDYRDSGSYLSIKETNRQVTVIPMALIQYFTFCEE